MGSNISRASLANPNLIDELGLKIGSEVFISKTLKDFNINISVDNLNQ
ncbi:unnamed protein product [marine sediment metagenome]|uniref:Uncharacterized protein n=1 Tax=marine sediment metagenome TaxID=412755 RepID=X0Z6A1_9ZZZZ